MHNPQCICIEQRHSTASTMYISVGKEHKLIRCNNNDSSKGDMLALSAADKE